MEGAEENFKQTGKMRCMPVKIKIQRSRKTSGILKHDS